jgi:hypothetical protein
VEVHPGNIKGQHKPSSSTGGGTLPHRFPNLALLLHFDAHQFLNVICACADAPVFANSDGSLEKKQLLEYLKIKKKFKKNCFKISI